MWILEYILKLLQGSVLYNFIKNGKLERSDGSSIAEGIGQGRVTANLKDAPIDDAHTILDTDAVKMVGICQQMNQLKYQIIYLFFISV